MCGIVGVVRPEGVEAPALRAMIAAIAHRGPDGEGLATEGPVGFGHCRLAVIDPTSSRQPMASADGRCWITFNGEIYNFRELAVRVDDAPWRTRGDTEVLLRLLERHGEAALAGLRGMFAFAFYDFERRRLLLARDHLGQKPLYYWHDGPRFAFASEIKALLALEPGLAEVDPDALHEYLTLRVVTAPRSMFRRIRKVPPGHYVVFEDGRLVVEPYWRLRFEPKRRVAFDAAVEELDARLTEAVSYHLVSDVPVGAFLSGGMDSSLVVAAMRNCSGRAFDTFTGDLPYAGRSEAPYARAVARRYDLPNHALTVEPALSRSLPHVVWHLDEPADALSVCLYHLAALARRHVKVVLGGDGGDELFGGYDRYYGNRYVDYYALLPAGVRRRLLGPLIARLSGGSWYRSMGHRLKWLQQLASFEGGMRYAKSLGYFYVTEEARASLYTERFAREIAAFDPERAIAAVFDTADATEALDRMLHVDYRTRLPDHPLMILDRMTMAHGLEARSPLLDPVLTEHCATLPADYKIRRTQTRVIEKALARRHVPAGTLNRSKQGFASPLTYMLRDEFEVLYRKLLTRSVLVEDGYLRADGLGAMLAAHLQGRQDHGQRLWLVFAAEIWYRIRVRGEAADAVEERLQRRAA